MRGIYWGKYDTHYGAHFYIFKRSDIEWAITDRINYLAWDKLI